MNPNSSSPRQKALHFILVIVQLVSAIGTAAVATIQPAALEPLVGAPARALAAPITTQTTITGTVFRDANGNGVNNAEAGIANATVNALCAIDSGPNNTLGGDIGASVDDVYATYTATTNASGQYAFTNVAGWPCRVFLNIPSGYFAGPHGPDSQGPVVMAPTIDTNGNPIVGSGSGGNLSSPPATFSRTVNFGLVQASDTNIPTEYTGQLWGDGDNDGLMEPGEPAWLGIPVSLLDSNGNTVATAATGNDGKIYFSTATGTNTTSEIFGLTLAPSAQYRVVFNISTIASLDAVSAGRGVDRCFGSSGVQSEPNGAGIAPKLVTVDAPSPVKGLSACNNVGLGHHPPRRYDFGDAPDSYHTSSAANGAYERVDDQGQARWLGLCVTQDAWNDTTRDNAPFDINYTSVLPSLNANGDDQHSSVLGCGQDDGVTFSPMIPGQPMVITLTAPSRFTNLYLNAWFDWNGNGAFEAGERVIDGGFGGSSCDLSSDGGNTRPGALSFFNMATTPVTRTIQVPMTAAVGSGAPGIYSRFRASSICNSTAPDGLPPGGFGEVEDYVTPFYAPSDFGDAPASYGTLLADNGPRHGIDSILRIGAAIDAESDGQPSALASGDDTNGTPDDEDGVQVKSLLRPGAKGIISVGTYQALSTNAHLSAWIDFNQNGNFSDAGEQIAADIVINGDSIHTTTNNIVVVFDIPLAAVSGSTFARFRLCSAAGSCNTLTGAAADGEVEDHRLQIETISKLGDKVWLDVNSDGIQQTGEPGVPGVIVKLVRSSDNAIVNITATDASGYYSFTNVMSGTYYAEFVTTNSYTFTLANQGSDSSVDSDANLSTGKTGNVALNTGTTNATVDAGLIAVPNRVTVCEMLPWQLTEVVHTFALPKFNPGLGTLNSVGITAYAGGQQWIGFENSAVNPQTYRVMSSSDGYLTLPDASSVTTQIAHDTGFRTLGTFDGIIDFTGGSSFAYNDWQYAFNAQSANYTPVASFIAASPGETINLPYETLSGFSTMGGGGNVINDQKTWAMAGVCLTYAYTPAPVGAVTLRKAVTTTDGSAAPTVSGTFNIQASCVLTPSALSAGGTVNYTGIASGTVCAATENTTNMPAAPSGYTWAGWNASAPVTITTNATSTLTVTNFLAPLPAVCKLYVSDYGVNFANPPTDDSIRKFEPATGAWLADFTPIIAANDSIHVWGIDAFGGVLYTATDTGGSVVKHSLNGAYLGVHIPNGAPYTQSVGGSGTVNNVQYTAFDAVGNIYLALGGAQVVRFDANGQNGAEVVRVGWGLRNIAIDPANGDIYVAVDTGSGLGGQGGIARYSSAGVLLDRNDLATQFNGSSGGWGPANAFGMVLRNGKLYLAHSNGTLAQTGVLEVNYNKVGSGNTYTSVWNTDFRWFAQNAGMNDPRDLEFGPDDGNLYVTQHAGGSSAVYKFNGTTGALITSFTAPTATQFKALAFGCPNEGTIRVVKQTINGDGTFDFSSADSDLAAISLTTNSGTASSAVITKTAGTYTISEDALSGWTLTDIAFSGDSDNGSTKTVGIRQAQIDLDAGEAITVTFTNTKDSPPAVIGAGTLTITKTVIGNGTGPFSVTVNGPSGYLTTTSIDGGQTKVITGLLQGIYTVTEASPGAGWLVTYTVTSGQGITSSTNAVVTLTNPITATPFAATVVTGTVYQDFNANGNRNTTGTAPNLAVDAGISNVLVSAYGVSGAFCGSASTNISGTYSFTPSCAGPWRLEYTNLPAGYEPSRVITGTQNGTSVQFINSAAQATGANFAINRPADYCQANPLMCTNQLQVGNQMTGTNANKSALLSFLYSNSGTSPAGTREATAAQIGTTWGLAWDRTTKKIYAAAFLKRHTGFGPNGPGAIYQVSAGVDGVMGTADDTPSLFLNLTSLSGVAVGTDPHTTASTETCVIGANDWCHDVNAFPLVGKMSLGDIDISDDDSTLWVMNLYDRKLYQIPIANPAGFSSFAAPDPGTGATGCPLDATTPAGQLNLNVRPFALKYYNGKVYVGEVCTAQSTQNRNDLRGFVYEFNGSSFTQVLNFPLTAPRGFNVDGLNESWNPWRDAGWPPVYGTFNSEDHVAYQQPWLTDIEFDRGNMILGFRDRFGDQSGYQAGNLTTSTNAVFNGVGAGEIYRACTNGAGGWTFESNASCGGVTTTGANNGQGPGPGPGPNTGYGEYYYQDNINADHLNLMMGGLAQGPGFVDVAGTTIDPINLMSNGIIWHRNANGTKTKGYELIPNPGAFGKANGLGDLELLCNAAPIEIGNRAWNDVNGNGVQDAGESGINGLQVTLSWSGGSINTTTSIDGNYYFTREAATGAYSQTLASNKAYTITFGVPAGYTLTVPNMQALSGASVSSNDAISDVRDSDAVLIGNVPTILYTTGNAGQNNHGLDAGFTQPLSAGVSITNTPPQTAQFGDRLWIEDDNDGQASTGIITPVAGKIITATSSAGMIYTTTTDSAGYYSFTVPNGVYTVTYGSAPNGTIPSATPGGNSVSGNAGSYQQSGNPDQSHANGTVVTVGAGQANWLVDFGFWPLPPNLPVRGVLTVTKQVNGAGNGPFSFTVSGPNGYVSNTTISAGGQVVFGGLVPGIYTVTEASPGAGWVMTYTVTSGQGVTSTSNAVVTLTGVITATPFNVTQITGTVFTDYNSDGNITANGVVTDTGVQSVTVTAYALNGTTLGPVQTDASGRYTITTSGAQGPFRLEFTNLPSGYQPSRLGTSNGSSTQFVTSAAEAGNVNFGINYPADYCQNNPELCSVIQLAAAYTDTNNSTKQSIVTFPYSAGSPPQMVSMAQYDSPAKGPTLVQNSNVGSTWGLAYRRSTKTIYAAAFMKKHAGFGPNGPGAIYQIAKDSTSASLFADLNALFGAGTAGVDPHTASNNWIDDNFNTTWDAVGKTSLGGIAVSEDDTKLYVMNLKDRKLYELPLIGTPTSGNSRRSVAAFDSAPSCPASGDVRPFALQVYRGNIYVGVTCTGESTGLQTDMRAYVYKVDPMALTWGAPVFQFNLNYLRSWLEAKSGSTTALWRPWVTTYTNNSSGAIADINNNFYLHYPQPWLTDIVFDQGNLVLGLRDRLGDQGGAGVHSNPASPTALYVAEAAGDTLRACGSLDNWVLESNARCAGLGNGPQNNTGANAAHKGPGNGEYYFHEEWQWLEVGIGGSAGLPAFAGDVFHSETSLGSLAQIPGYPDVLATTFDPVPWRGNPTWSATWDSGIHWWNNSTGDFTKAYRVVDGGSSLMTDYFGKANGLGDLAILCDAAPIEIGNRVWYDVNANGIQDPGEPPIAGVQVQLGNPTTGAVLQTATTNISGTYVFTREAATGAYSQTLRANTAYSVSIATGLGALAGYTLTMKDAQGNQSNDNINDVRDSDATQLGANAVIYYTTGGPGQNNHGLDFGFTQPPSARVNITNTPPANLFDLGNRVWFDTNNNGALDSGEQPVAGVTVTLQTPTGTLTTLTDASGYYSFTNLPAGVYTPAIAAANFQPAGALFGYLSSSGATSTYTTTDNNRDHGIDPLSLAAYPVNGVSGAPVTLGAGLQPIGEDGSAPGTPNGDASNNLTADFGFYRQQVGNTIWLDANNDGLLNNGETPYTAGPITVTLLDNSTGSVVSTTTTNNGIYTFTGVPSGTFVVSITVPAGYRSSNGQFNAAGADDNDNGAPSGAFIASQPFTMTPGTNLNTIASNNAGGTTVNPSIDFGLYAPLVNLGNQVWFDVNDNGSIDNSEQGIQNVRVELYRDTNNDGFYTPGVDQYVAFSNTVAGGYYTFTNLLEDNYVVVITSTNFNPGNTLAGYVSSTPTENDPNANVDDNDNGIVTGALGSGGYVASKSISLTVGSEPSTVTSSGDSNWTVDFGFLKLLVGDLVWLDSNNNGVVDAGEQPIPNVPVAILDNAGNVLKTTTTDASGLYTFTGLISGTYVISITPPAGYVSSDGQFTTDAGNDNDHGAPNGNFITSQPFALTPGGGAGTNDTPVGNGTTENKNLDFGIYVPVSLGNRVWFDTNNDGLDNENGTPGSSVGASGVTVQLYQDSNGDGVFSAGDALLSSTVTNASGYYSFTQLKPTTFPTQTYLVVLPASNFASAGALNSYQSSTDIATTLTPDGNRDYDDNGAVMNGALGSGGFVASRPITLTSGNEPAGEINGANDLTADTSSNLTLDFGFYKLVLGNLVWRDVNNDGLWNNGETGIPNLTVTLLDNAGNVVSITTTDAGGYYTFTNLISGTYVVSATTPAQHSSSLGAGNAYEPAPNPNSNGTDSDDNGTSSTGLPAAPFAVSAPLNLTPGSTNGGASPNNNNGTTTNPNLDFGFYPLGVNLGNQVWFDTNNNGVIDGSEQGIVGVVVELYRNSDNNGVFTPGMDVYAGARTTVAGGYYTFTALTPDNYVVVITSTNFNAGGALLGYQNSTPTENDPNANVDHNDNGIPYPSAGSGPYVASKAISLTLGSEPSQTVVAGDSNWTVDFGFYRLELGNTVWNDVNNNGLQDNGESGVPNVTVTLFSNGNVVSTTLTDANGVYGFTNLVSGTYTMSIQMPAGYQSSSDIASSGTPISADRDDNGVSAGTVTVSTAPFNLTPGVSVSGVQTATDSNGVTVNPSVDFGIWQPVSLGNQVWFDTNNNGVLDNGEVGVANVTVELYRDNGDGVYTPGVDQLISNTTTIAGGYYTFTNLLEGGYVVVIPGANFSTSGALAGYRSSNGSVTGNSDLNNRDHGDENAGLANGSAPSFVASSVVTLTVGGEPANDDLGSNGIDANGNGTIDFGFYKLELGNLVWEDKNNNGAVDASEPIIPNVVVELRDPTSDALISTTTTNSSGYYTFTNLVSGTYRVVLTATNFLPSGALASLTSSTGVNGSASGPYEPGVNETNDLSLENIDHGTIFGALGSTGVVRSGVITLTPGAEPLVTNNAALSQQPTIDFGLFKPAGLGNYVWYDLNHDGVQNNSAGEAGVSGVTVTLFSNGVPISTTFTDATGFYVFTNLVQGTYSVTFRLPGTLTFTVPSGTTPDASDTDSDAKVIAGQTGATESFPLGYGEFKPQIDAGVWQPAGLGDTIWIDTNGNGVQESGEPGVPGVTATLLIYSPTVNGFVQLSQTVTGNGGYYEFTGLISATYQVVFDTPAGYTWTVPLVGSVISDSNVITPSMGGTAPVVLNAGEFNPTIDGGLVPYAALGDYVWEDINHDGFQNNDPSPGSGGVNGVLVTLYLNGAPISTTNTFNYLGKDGYYTFTSLISGTYSVTFGLPTGYQWTKVTANSGDTTLANAGGVNDSNVVNLSSGGTNAIVLNWGVQNPTIDAGIWRPASLGDYVWEDFNHDGQQNDGNTGINNVTVKLLDGNGNVVSTTTTFTGGPLNQPGYYTFTNLISGTYSVQFTAPSGYTWTLPNTGNDVSDSDASITGTTGSYTLFPGDSIPTVDAGLWRPASLGDTVWFDINHNGAQDGGAEVGVPNIGVKLLDGNGNVLSTTVTDANGLYTFTNLISATYQVQFDLTTLPPKYQPTVQGVSGSKDLTDSDASPITGKTEQIVLVAGENDKSWDFGIWQPASLGDYVWEDLNHNGVQDNGEPGVPGVTVTLLSSGGTVVSTTTTDANGYYSFTQLVPTQYTVVFTPTATYTFTLPTVGITTTDSNPNPINGWTLPVVLAPGEHNPTIDAGLWRPMSLGNQVWFDTNDNGRIDAGEVGVDGVMVQLYIDNGDGLLNPAADLLTKTTVTANGGYYTFTQLISGTYFVVIPSGNFTGTGALVRYQSSDPTAINPNNDADNDDNGVTVGALGQANGYVASGSIVMRPGTEPTTASGEVAANGGDADANTNWTIDFGFYTLSLGNLVWNDTNNNALRDGNEAGVPNVSVTLLDANGNPISTTLTDAGGFYTFTNLLSGTYSVRIAPPAGYQSSSDIASSANPNNDVDNDDNGVGGAGGNATSNPITLWPGAEPVVNNATGASANTTLDFGIWRPFSLGNRVWNDVNNNGVMDAADGAAPGIDGVVVRLLDTQGTLISTTTTSNGGYYRFDRLVAGDYIVEIAAGNFNAGGPLAGLRSSYVDDNNPNSDIDRNDNGIGRTPSITQGIRSGVVTLGTDAAPAEPTGETDLAPSGQGTDDNRANMTVDFGFFGPLVNLGNRVWFDANDNGTQDAGEPGLGGVKVDLYRDTNDDGVYTPGVDVFVSSRATSAAGDYSFMNLVEGRYIVVIAGTNFAPGGALASYRSSTPTETNPNADVDNNDDGIEVGLSNGVPAYVASNAIDLSVGDEPSMTLAAGDSNWTVDFGFWTPATLAIKKTSQSAALVKNGDLITYTLVVTNAGVIVAHGVRLTDTVPAGTTFVSATGLPVNPIVSGSPTVWNIGDMQPGAAFIGTFVVRVSSDSVSTGAIVNKAALSFINEHVTSVSMPSNEVQNPFAPTAVTLAKFAASPTNAGVRVIWQTALERDTFGFNVWRSATGNRADAVKVNAELIAAKGGNALTDYSLDDAGGSVNSRYWLEEIELDGMRNEYGPVVAGAALPGASQSQPAVQPAMQPAPGVGVAGGVVVAQPMAQSQEPGAESQISAEQPAQQPAVMPAAPAVIASQAQAQPATEAQPAVEQPSQAENVPAMQPEAAQPEQAQLEQAAQPAAQPQRDTSIEVKTDAVAVARGGQAMQPTLRQAQGTVKAPAEAAQPMSPLLPLSAGVLVLLGIGAMGAFVARQRKR